MNRYLNWKTGGLLLGFTFFIALFLIKPIGVSTQYSVTAGIIEDTLNKDVIYETSSTTTGYGSSNAYYNKSQGKLAKSIAKPLNYSYIFVGAMILGGLLSSLTIPKKTSGATQENEAIRRTSPQVVRETISTRPAVRYALAFVGGLISLFGARLAGGCTSGHMMSGISQTALSGMVFAAIVFATAIPTAILLYRQRN